MNDPLVSIVTVTFNGSHFLPPLLESLAAQSYARREVIVVDNASTDGTAELVRRNYPDARVLRLERNLGFAGGNNAGIRAAAGDLIALINNDTVAEPRWLEFLVEALLSDPELAAVGSKLVFLRQFLPVRLKAETFRAAEVTGGSDTRELGVLFDEASGFAGCDYRKPIFKRGFYAPERIGESTVRWTSGDAVVLLPVQSTECDGLLELVVSVGEGVGRPRRLRLEVGDALVGEIEVASERRCYSLPVAQSVIAAEALDVINNAGTDVTRRGETADRGIYELDRGQWDECCDVAAICGAAVLFRRTALDEVGAFDRDFFMYYEDVDLSCRLRGRGYRLRYEPRAVVRHAHAATSVEWSPLFCYYTARNRLLMLAKNGSVRAFIGACGQELRSTTGALGRMVRDGGGLRASRARSEVAVRLRVYRSLFVQLPRAFLKRSGVLRENGAIQRSRRRPQREMGP
jgi:O-antigen biosynthesis protein